MTLPLIFSIAALFVAVVAFARAYVPPAQRQVKQLRADVQLLADDVEAIHERLASRARQANMAKARESRAGGRPPKVDDDLLAAAQARVAAAGQATAAAPEQQQLALPNDEKAARARLRAMFLLPPGKAH